jgi:dienelactone hydrolase
VPADGWTSQENQRAELDVLYALSVVTAEYNADTSRVFLHGQNPSGSAAFHFGAKYPQLFKAIIVSAGPIISTDYPVANLKGKVAVMMLSGERDSRYTAAASERMTRELQQHGIDAQFHLVPGGEHLNAYLLFAPQVFDFLDKQ